MNMRAGTERLLVRFMQVFGAWSGQARSAGSKRPGYLSSESKPNGPGWAYNCWPMSASRAHT